MSRPLILTDALRGYDRTRLRCDLIAGATVAIVAVPQGMAYALVAGVPVQYGLYAAMAPAIVAALLGSSRHLVTGPTFPTAILVFSIIHPLLAAGKGPEAVMPVVFLLAVLSGVVMVLAGLVRIGNLVRYVSQAVVVGFITGAAVLIIANQVHSVLGIRPTAAGWPTWTPVVLRQLEGVLADAGEANGRAIAVAVGVAIFVLVCARLDRRIPAAILAIGGAGLVVRLGGWTHGELELIGRIPRSLPPLSRPWMTGQAIHAYAGGAVAIALLGVVQALTIAKSVAARSGQRIWPNRELIAQGLARIVGGLTSSIPPSASLGRTALNYQAGARTPIAAASSGLFVAAIVLAFAGWARWIPQAALAAIIICAAADAIDLGAIRRILTGTRADAAVLVITLIAALSIPLHYALYLGVAMSIILVVRQTSALQMAEMVSTGGGRFREIDVDEQTGTSPVVLLQLEGAVYFGVADELEAQLRQIASRGARVIILRTKRAHHFDATVAERLKRFAEDFRSRGGVLLLCGMRRELRDMLHRTGLDDAIGPRNLLLTDRDVFGSVRRALERARELLGGADRPLLRQDPELNNSADYEI